MSERSQEVAAMSIAKFGGESMLAMEIVRDRLFEDEHRRVAVVSALGKLSISKTAARGYPGGIHDQKVTDQLIEYSKNGSQKLLEEIVGRHAFEADRLKVYGDTIEQRIDLIKGFREDIESHYQNGEFADVQLMGEIMSAKLLAAYLGDDAEFIDPRDVIVFEALAEDEEDNHPIDLAETARLLRGKITDSPSRRYIIGGFGGQFHGTTHLLQRSGTDVIGAAVTNALGANLYEIFKEAKGVYVTNPSLLSRADIQLTDEDIIRKATYDEIRDVGVAGAEVVQRDAIGYLWNKNEPQSTTKDIATIVRSASRPDDTGTKLVPRRSSFEHETIINFNVRRYAYVKLHKYNMKGKQRHMKQLQDFMAQFDGGITWEHMLTGTDSITAVMSSGQFSQWVGENEQADSLPDFDDFIDGLKTTGMNVESYGPIGAVHLIGQEHANPHKSIQIAAKMSNALARHGIDNHGHIWQIDTTASIWFIGPGEENAAVAAVYEEFFG